MFTVKIIIIGKVILILTRCEAAAGLKHIIRAVRAMAGLLSPLPLNSHLYVNHVNVHLAHKYLFTCKSFLYKYLFTCKPMDLLVKSLYL